MRFISSRASDTYIDTCVGVRKARANRHFIFADDLSPFFARDIDERLRIDLDDIIVQADVSPGFSRG